ncbi:hypothetical protein HK096_003142 [Nowakowskiella sp. JEL0078]|nr:hypothetical protein HK096_003142 [Nowakowskiella sp. JEL0078]
MTQTIDADPYPWPYNGKLSPSNSAIVVIDMQNDFCSPGGYIDSMGYSLEAARAIIPNIQAVLGSARQKGFHIIHTREGHRSDLADLPLNKQWRSRKVGVNGVGIGDMGPLGSVLIRGEKGWEIIPELLPIEGETIIDKPGKGSFYGTDLAMVLDLKGIQNLVILGVTTDVCVHTTCREANDRGFECLILTDSATDKGNYEDALFMIKQQGVQTKMKFLDDINVKVAKSSVGRYFKLKGSGVEKERDTTCMIALQFRAGATTYVTMAYIVAVNAIVVSQSGGGCVCNGPGICETDPAYLACVDIVRRDLVTGTAAMCAIACFLMGLGANLPICLAPGLGGSAYFTYTVVGFYGTKSVKFKDALAAIFIEGLIFMVLSIFGIRQWLARHIPPSIKVAAGAGIGLFLTHIGLQYSAGIGLISHNSATLVDIGGCPVGTLDGLKNCTEGQQMQSPTLWLGIIGFFMIVILMNYKVKGSILIGVLFVGIISWFRGTAVTAFPYTPAGDSSFAYFSKVVDLHKMEKTLGALNFDLSTGSIWQALIIFLFVDILDTTGTLFSMARFGGYVDEFGDFEGSYPAFIIDAFCISIGTLFGMPPMTAYIESGAGISEGGKTGLTAMFASVFFFLSIFFAPIFSSFPPWASGPALIFVGSLMIGSVVEINWNYLGDAVPAFITIAVMPLTYSIAYGLIGGIGSYVVINLAIGAIDMIIGLFGEKATKYKSDQSLREPWKSFDDGTFFFPAWFVKRYMPKTQSAKVELRAKYLESIGKGKEVKSGDYEEVKTGADDALLENKVIAEA